MLNSSYNDHAPLKKPHYPKKNMSCAWWTRFHDPQLNQLIQTALTDSPRLQIAESRVRQAQQFAALAHSDLLPSVVGYGDIARERITSTGIFPPPIGGNRYTETNFGLNFNYEFDFWGKNRQVLASRVSLQRAAQADWEESRLVLATSVTSTYFQLQSSIYELQLAEAILRQQQELLNIITVRAHHGVASDIPVTTATGDMETLKISVAQLREQVKISQHQLAALLGKNPFNTVIHVRKFAYDARLVAIPKVIPANLLARRPDLIAARLRMEAAAHEINAAKARFYPNINLLALLSLQAFDLPKAFELPSRDNSIGAAIDLPVFDAGARRANLGSKYAEYDNAVGSYNETILTGLREVADEASRLNSISAQQLAQKSVLRSAVRNYDLVLAQYQHGIVDYTNVLQSRTSMLRERNEQTDLQTQHLKSMIAMIKALGGTYIKVEG
jgi:NodT family efflux transporter outer membrane factor (OMF) lipoprotein